MSIFLRRECNFFFFFCSRKENKKKKALCLVGEVLFLKKAFAWGDAEILGGDIDDLLVTSLTLFFYAQ